MGNIAAIFSFFIPGLGQLYNKEIKKGFLFLIGILTSLILSLNSTGFVFELRFLRAISLLIYFILIASILWLWSIIDAAAVDRDINLDDRKSNNISIDQFLDQGYTYSRLNYFLDVLSRVFETIIVTYITVVLIISDKTELDRFAHDITAEFLWIILFVISLLLFKILSFLIKMMNANWDVFELYSSTSVVNFLSIRKMLDFWTINGIIGFLGYLTIGFFHNRLLEIFDFGDNTDLVFRNIDTFSEGAILLIILIVPVYLMKLISIIIAKIDLSSSLKWNFQQIWLDLLFGIARIYGLLWIAYNLFIQQAPTFHQTVENLLSGASWNILGFLYYIIVMFFAIIIEFATEQPILID